MSRSYRKPYWKDRNPWAKNQANRRVRKKSLPSGGAYKKAYCSYNISDWSWEACPETKDKAARK